MCGGGPSGSPKGSCRPGHGGEAKETPPSPGPSGRPRPLRGSRGDGQQNRVPGKDSAEGGPVRAGPRPWACSTPRWDPGMQTGQGGAWRAPLAAGSPMPPLTCSPWPCPAPHHLRLTAVGAQCSSRWSLSSELALDSGPMEAWHPLTPRPPPVPTPRTLGLSPHSPPPPEGQREVRPPRSPHPELGGGEASITGQGQGRAREGGWAGHRLLPQPGSPGQPSLQCVAPASGEGRSLVLGDIVEPALGPEQPAAGLVVGDPVLQVFGQLGRIHLQGEGGGREARSPAEVKGGAPLWASADASGGPDVSSPARGPQG